MVGVGLHGLRVRTASRTAHLGFTISDPQGLHFKPVKEWNTSDYHHCYNIAI